MGPRAGRLKPSFGQIWRLAIPVMLGNASVPLVGLVDSAVAGRLSAQDVGAVALGSSLFHLIAWSFGFLRLSAVGLVAQARGAGEFLRGQQVLVRAVLVATTSALVLLALSVPLWTVAALFIDGAPAAEAGARVYFLIRVFALPATLSLYALYAWLYGVGDVVRPMIVLVAANGLNIVLNVVFALVLGWGVVGIALASVVADWSALVLVLIFIVPLWRRGRAAEPFWSRSAFGRFFSLSANIAVRNVLLLSVFLFFTVRAASFGEQILAAFGILLQLALFTAFVLDGVSTSAEILVGGLWGRLVSRWRELMLDVVLINCFVAALGLALVIAALYALFGEALIAAMTSLSEVQRVARTYWWFVVIVPITGSFCYVWDGAFFGATLGRALRNSAVITSLTALVLMEILPRFFGQSGLWMSLHVFFLHRALMLHWWWCRLRRARLGRARLGRARLGRARRGRARLGRVRLGCVRVRRRRVHKNPF